MLEYRKPKIKSFILHPVLDWLNEWLAAQLDVIYEAAYFLYENRTWVICPPKQGMYVWGKNKKTCFSFQNKYSIHEKYTFCLIFCLLLSCVPVLLFDDYKFNNVIAATRRLAICNLQSHLEVLYLHRSACYTGETKFVSLYYCITTI